uniref:Uncharacterized protein n=1 Tax=Lepeophtheirus salmonis TaxID=72036 RepID=A0A0K2SZI5_LEPSM
MYILPSSWPPYST